MPESKELLYQCLFEIAERLEDAAVNGGKRHDPIDSICEARKLSVEAMVYNFGTQDARLRHRIHTVLTAINVNLYKGILHEANEAGTRDRFDPIRGQLQSTYQKFATELDLVAVEVISVEPGANLNVRTHRTAPAGIPIADMRRRLDVDVATIRRHCLAAKIKTAKRGGRNHCFSVADARKLCQQMAEHGAADTRNAALKMLEEIDK